MTPVHKADCWVPHVIPFTGFFALDIENGSMAAATCTQGFHLTSVMSTDNLLVIHQSIKAPILLNRQTQAIRNYLTGIQRRFMLQIPNS